jgi:hypothetical protein
MSDDMTLSVQLVSIAGGTPIAANGQAKMRSPEVIELDVGEDLSHLKDGDRVILSFPGAELPRMEAVIRDIQGSRLLCSTERLREAERRDYPRLHGGVPLRFQVVRGPGSYELVAGWLEGSDEALTSGEWIEPDEFMNFSVTGLAFDGDDSARPNDLLLLEMRLRNKPDSLRATARVIRVYPLNDKDSDHTHRIAVQFEDLPEPVRRALADMTLDIQDSFF